MNFIVYLAKSPSNKYYIGITTQLLSERVRKHYILTKNPKTKFHKALRKYKKDMKWRVLGKYKSKEIMLKKEIYYIKKYDSYKSGYNSTLGGELNLGRVVSKYTKNKLSKLNTGRNNPNFGKERSLGSRLKSAKNNGTKPFKVIQKKSNKVVGIWNIKKQCARDLNLNYQYISFCLREKQGFKSHKGYIFKYTGDSHVTI
jgi:predicted GIY-YIG superfamily endonuclease